MYIITSYFTLDTPYEKVIEDYLLPSLQDLGTGISYYISPIYNLGSHQKNANYKPRFIYEMMCKFPNQNIVFLDADAEVLCNPILFDNIKEDIACHNLDWSSWYSRPSNRKELLPGTLYVRNEEYMRTFIKKWADLAQDSNLWDGKILEELLKVSSVTFYNLPLEYCYIKTLPNGQPPHIKIEQPVIVHNQVSRLYRKGDLCK